MSTAVAASDVQEFAPAAPVAPAAPIAPITSAPPADKVQPAAPDPQQGWPVSVWWNNEPMALTIPTVLIEGTTFVSVYDFCTLMGCRVLWHDGYATVTRGSELSATVTPGEIYMTANGRALYLSTPARIIGDRIMLPIRTLATIFDMSVAWNGEQMRVYLSGNGLLESGESYYDPDTLYWLSRIISAEARGEPLIGQIAVGNVVFNRVADEEFPETVYGVIFDRVNGVQFTPAGTGEVYAEPREISVLAAKLCLEGADYSCGATYFISEKVVECFATLNKKLLTTIGGHRFYG
jgi:N-acetylmuramoyl-L-alanine amidase